MKIMKMCFIIWLFMLPGISLHAQDPGDLYPGFGENGIYQEDWPDTTSTVSDIVVLPNGHIILAGGYGNVDYDGCVLKMNESGDLLSFGNSSRGLKIDFLEGESVEAVCPLPDGKMIVAGHYLGETFVNPFVVRLLSNGQIDPSFGIDGLYTDETIRMFITDMEIQQTDGSYKIIMSGYNPDPYPLLLVLKDDGTPETSVGSGGLIAFNDHRAHLTDLVVDSEDNFMITCGYINDGIGTILLKYNLTDGTPDVNFGDNGVIIYSEAEGSNAQTFAAAFDKENNTLTLFGKYEHEAGDMDMFAYRINTADGNPDASFGAGGWSTLRYPGSNEVISHVLLQSDLKYYIGGTISISGSLNLFIGRITHNGVADLSFGTNGFVISQLAGIDYVSSLALSPAEDRLYIAYNLEGDFSIRIAACYTKEETEPVNISGEEMVHGGFIYPNPSTGRVHLTSSANGPHRVQVLDIAGKKLIEKEFEGNTYILNLHDFMPSVYFVRVTMPDKQEKNFKLIKQ